MSSLPNRAFARMREPPPGPAIKVPGPGRLYSPLLDLSGLGPGEKRAALMEIQGGKCAVDTGWKGGCKGTLAADHDHRTGLLRGLLCGPHNRQEGRACRPEMDGFADYRANPPAGHNWMWAFPDWWRLSDTVTCLEDGLTVLEYVRRNVDARCEEEAEAVAQAARRAFENMDRRADLMKQVAALRKQVEALTATQNKAR